METNNQPYTSTEVNSLFSEKFWSIAKKVLLGVTLALGGAFVFGKLGGLAGAAIVYAASLGTAHVTSLILGGMIGSALGILGGATLGGVISSKL